MSDLVDRQFVAPAPIRLLVADLTYVKTHTGWTYVAFIIDVFSRAFVARQASQSLRNDLAVDALEMAIYSRNGRELSSLIDNPDRGQYLSFQNTLRLREGEIVVSAGSKGDGCDCSVESFNGLYKTELIYHKGLWRDVEHVEWVTLNYGDWFSNLQIHGSPDYMPLVGFGVVCYNSSGSEICPCRK